MQAWIQDGADGRQYLVRTGTGVVTAVVPVGIVDPDERHTLYRVELYCDAPHGRPGSIRYSAHPVVAGGTPLHAAALEALEQVWPVAWTIEWHAHDWIPADLPIASLNLVTDARCVLAGLDRVVVPEPLDDLPDFVPVAWTREGRGEPGGPA
ncbi:MAG: hypothetical protein ACYC2Z_09585 [Candidatus Nanopelagicales bacterium]